MWIHNFRTCIKIFRRTSLNSNRPHTQQIEPTLPRTNPETSFPQCQSSSPPAAKKTGPSVNVSATSSRSGTKESAWVSRAGASRKVTQGRSVPPRASSQPISFPRRPRPLCAIALRMRSRRRRRRERCARIHAHIPSKGALIWPRGIAMPPRLLSSAVATARLPRPR